MAFESKIDAAVDSKKDFNGSPSCKCGRQSVIAMARVVNVNTGEQLIGAASEFSCRDKEKRPNGILQSRYALQEFRGYCSDCWEGVKPQGKRTFGNELVRNAWMWFIGHLAKDSGAMSALFSNNPDATIEQQEEYLQVVNTEAKRCNAPDSIPNEYKLAEVWR